MTNIERIKTMNIQELAKFFGDCFCCEYECPARAVGCYDDCLKAIKNWLEREN